MKYRRTKLNKDRAEFALSGLEVATDNHGNEETDVTDMLCNLMHLCEQNGWSFDGCLDAAVMHFDEERDGK